jgi:hypothetical protein
MNTDLNDVKDRRRPMVVRVEDIVGYDSQEILVKQQQYNRFAHLLQFGSDSIYN